MSDARCVAAPNRLSASGKQISFLYPTFKALRADRAVSGTPNKINRWQSRFAPAIKRRRVWVSARFCGDCRDGRSPKPSGPVRFHFLISFRAKTVRSRQRRATGGLTGLAELFHCAAASFPLGLTLTKHRGQASRLSGFCVSIRRSGHAVPKRQDNSKGGGLR
jgi:hypothetical protein